MILVSGSLAYDYIMNFPGYFRDHILPEKLHVLSVSFLVDKMQKNFGGTAGNISYNLALLGEKPTILASVGNDFAEYEQWLQSPRSARLQPRKGDAKASHYIEGVDLSYVRRVKDVPTASCHITTDNSDNQITAFHLGAMAQSVVKAELFSRQSSALRFRQAKVAIVAPGNLEDMRALPKLYKKLGVPYIYDPGQNITALSGADLRAGIAGAKVFISNDYELALVLKKTGWKKQDVLERVEVLVTTLGEKGSVIEIGLSCHNSPQPPLTLRGGVAKNPLLFSQGESAFGGKIRGGAGGVMKFVIPPARAKNVCDPTGAGDAYRAGFIKGLLMGLPYDKVGKLAGLVSVYTVEQYGTQTHRFSWQGLLKRYKENYGETLL